MNRCRATLLVLASVWSVSGCGNGQPTGDVVPTVTAKGTLTHKGAPLAYHQVNFFPEKDGRPASGVSGEDGQFVLGTNAPNDGATTGSNRVAVQYVGPPNTNPEAGMNDFSPPPPPKVKIDKKYTNIETSGLTIEIPSSGKSDIQIDLP